MSSQDWDRGGNHRGGGGLSTRPPKARAKKGTLERERETAAIVEGRTLPPFLSPTREGFLIRGGERPAFPFPFVLVAFGGSLE